MVLKEPTIMIAVIATVSSSKSSSICSAGPIIGPTLQLLCQSFGCCYQPMGDDADFGAADKANGATPAIAKRVHQIVDLTNVPDDDVAGATPSDRSEIVDQPVYVGMHEAGFVTLS
jgi:hypothetical protein